MTAVPDLRDVAGIARGPGEANPSDVKPLVLLVVLLLPLGDVAAQFLRPVRVPQDHPTITEAVDAIQAALANGFASSQTVVVSPSPDGAYGPVTIAAPQEETFFLTIRASGKVIIDGQGASSAITLDWPRARAELIGLRVRNGAPHGVLRTAGELTLLRCTIEDSAVDGVHLVSDPTVGFTAGTIVPSFGEFRDVDINRCKLLRSGMHHVATQAPLLPTSTQNTSSIRRSRLEDAGASAVFASGDANNQVFVRDSRITGTVTHGVEAASGHSYLNISRNTFREIGLDGLHLESPAGFFANDDVRENRIHEPGEDGIDAAFALFGNFGNSPIFNIVRNRITGGLGHGVVIRSGAPGLVRNTVSGPALDGIRLEAGSNVDVSLNRVSKCGNDGFVITGNETPFFRNRSNGSAGTGFLVSGSDNDFQQNRAQGNGVFDLSDTGTGNTFTDNVFGTEGP